MAYFSTGSRGSHWPAPHHGMVAEYQQSSIPYVTGSTHDGFTFEHTFPFVTRWIVVTNSSDTAMKIGFTRTGIDANQYINVPANSMTPRLELKCTSLFTDGTNAKTYEIMAGLTNIQSGSFPGFTASTAQGL